MGLRITTLSENTVTGRMGLLAEWGLSILVEVDNLNILLDTGQSVSTVHNANALGVDLSQIEKIILSHGHYDHTGGLREVLTRTKKEMEIIAHPEMWASKYGYNPNEGRYIYIGIPFQREMLENLGASFRLTPEPVWLTENVVTSGEIPMVNDYEKIDANLYIKEGEEFRPDPLGDDQALFIKTEQGLVVILGCAHRGTINTLYHAQKLTGIEVIHTVIGGTHLIRASELQLEQTIAELRAFGVQRLGVSHCTGMPAANRLSLEFGESFFFNNSGTQITL
jgi:7,8-dihydropterin-6-yl-methyl-4-(beta-D-ribofuranosyl)aminobenzene 5'-phosphate synthase